MSLIVTRVAPDARSFKGRYVRKLERIEQEKSKEAYYRQFLEELGVERI